MVKKVAPANLLQLLKMDVGPKGRLADLDNAYAAKERFGLLGAEAIRIIDQACRIDPQRICFLNKWLYIPYFMLYLSGIYGII